jgi:hypothetical protein
MKKTSILIIVALSFVMGVRAQRTKSALLPVSQAKALAEQCSRDSPRDYTDTWIPTTEQIRDMESKLGDISKLKAECCIQGETIRNPERWYLQYVGLVWHGKKIIYISAPDVDEPVYKLVVDGVVKGDWRSIVIRVCDGGSSWGVIYDSATHKFSNLSVNGVA